MSAEALFYAPGESIAGFRILEILGRGGVGTVYGAVSPEGRPVALKVAHSSDGVLHGDWLRREARVAARLRHPHIVEVLGVGELQEGAASRPFLVLGRVQGDALERLADRLSSAEIARLADQLLDALGYAHDSGVLHLDVSPNNILIRAGDGAALLTDFGLSSPRDRREGETRTLIAGTPGYMSPEQALGAGGVGPRSDLYALGAVLYRLISGFPPHTGRTGPEIIRRTLNDEAVPLKERPGIHLGAAACAVVDALLRRGAEDRPPCAAVARQLWREATDHVKRPATVSMVAPTPAIGITRATLIATQAMELPVVPDGPTRPGQSVRTAVVATPARGARRPSLQPTGAGGREAVIEALLLATEGSQIVRLVGPRGSGRSHIFDCLRRFLHERDHAVAWCTGRRATDAPPMETIAALAVDLVGASVGPPWVVAERLALALDTVGGGALRLGRDALTQGVLGITRRPPLGGARLETFRAMHLLRPPGRPLTLLVDDADRIDADSLEILRDLARGGVGVVLASCSEDAADPSVHVPALSMDRRLVLAGDEALAHSDATLADLALAGGLRQGQSKSAEARIRHALDIIGSAEHDALAIAALLHGEAPVRALGALGGAAGVDAVDALMDVGWIIPVAHAAARAENWCRLRSPLLEACIRDATREDRTRPLEVARWFTRQCFDQSLGVLETVADLATHAGEEKLAAFAAAEVGRRAATLHDPNAQRWIQRALDSATEGTSSAVDSASLRVELAQLHALAGETESCEREALAALGELGEERRLLRARALGCLGRARAELGDPEASVQRFRQAVHAVEGSDPTELATALSSLAWQLGYGMGQTAEAIALMQRALQEAERIDTPLFRARLCGRLGAVQLRAGDWDGQLITNWTDLGLSMLAGDISGVVRGHINIGVCFTNRGLLTLARAHTEEAAFLAEAHGGWTAAHIAQNNLATIACDQHRHDDAVFHVATANRLAARRGVSPLCETWAVRVRLCIRAGDLAGARAAWTLMQESARGAERPLCARIGALLEDGTERLQAAVAEGIADPYDDAATRLSLAARRGDEPAESAAIARLIELGADPDLERRRWLEP